MPKYLSKYILISLLLFGSLLFSINQDIHSEIAGISEYLIENPDDHAARISLGYLYMVTNQPLLALRAYRYVTDKDSSNLTAWQGVLWSYNAQRKWAYAIKASKIPLKLFPQDAIIKNHAAYAHWNSYNALAARNLYAKSNQISAKNEDIQLQSTSLDGLGWIYSAFGDYSLAYRAFNKSQSLMEASNPLPGMQNLKKPKQYTALSYANLENKKSSVSVGQYFRYKRLSASLGYEQFKINGNQFRDTWSAGMGFQLAPMQAGLKGWLLKGDADIYPAKIYQADLSEKFWLSNMLLEPIYRFGFSQYPDFNVYQNDAALNLTYNRVSLSAGIVRSDKDVEIINADASYFAFHGQMSYAFDKGVTVAISAGKGRQDWWISPVGYIVDTNVTNTKYIGNIIMLPLSKAFDLIYYQQLGYKQENWHYTGSVSLKVSY